MVTIHVFEGDLIGVQVCLCSTNDTAQEVSVQFQFQFQFQLDAKN